MIELLINKDNELFIIICIVIILSLSIVVVQAIYEFFKIYRLNNDIKHEQKLTAYITSHRIDCAYCQYNQSTGNGECRFHYFRECYYRKGETLSELNKRCMSCKCVMCIHSINRGKRPHEINYY